MPLHMSKDWQRNAALALAACIVLTSIGVYLACVINTSYILKFFLYIFVHIVSFTSFSFYQLLSPAESFSGNVIDYP